MPRLRKTSALKKRYGISWAPSSGKVQTLLFPRPEWPIQDALLWASVQGFKTKVFDVTESHVRVHPHGKKPKAEHTRTIPYGVAGIRAVVEWR
jgi:hypothetical protein